LWEVAIYKKQSKGYYNSAIAIAVHKFIFYNEQR